MAAIEALRDRLESVGQGHLLRFADELGEGERAALVAQIESIDLERVPAWVKTYVEHTPHTDIPAGVAPAPYFPLDGSGWDKTGARSLGESLIAEGKVACFTVAGGQGSRLGYDGPKGCYPGGAVTGKPLFQIFAEGVLAAGRRYGKAVPWCIMTSPLNHDATVSFFEEHSYFGLEQEGVLFFPQGSMPSFDMATGRILLAEKGVVATNPDGHGGALRALVKSGAVDRLKACGVEHLSYFQVDNPTVRVVDPVFIGLHASGGSSGEMSSKMVAKAHAEEKVGLFCSVDGRVRVIEYSDLPMDRQRETEADGRLRFLAGSIAIHVLGIGFVEKLGRDPSFALPFHRAEKKVAHVDLETGAKVEPSSANAVKLEQFVFDALEFCERSVVLETDRVEEFAPIKNAEGTDSPATSAALQTERAARWLSSVGVDVPVRADGAPDCTLEISPLTATEASELRGRDLPSSIERGAKVAL